jgi:hypothetical protein
MDVKEMAADAYAEVFRRAGFEAFAGSRMDWSCARLFGNLTPLRWSFFWLKSLVVVAYKKKNCCKKTTATSTSKKDPYVEKPPTKTLSTLCKFFAAQEKTVQVPFGHGKIFRSRIF